jgi:hypothetical protein
MWYAKQLVNFCVLLSLLFLNSCASTYEVKPFNAYVQLPASEKCFGLNVITGEEIEIPKEQCKDLMRRSVFLTSKDWAILRTSILQNCHLAQCKQFVGAFDELFLGVNEGLLLLPDPRP